MKRSNIKLYIKKLFKGAVCFFSSVMSAGKEKWTATGTGKCSKCTFIYSTFKNLERCTQCQFYLRGKFVPKEGTSSNRKRKLNNPEALFRQYLIILQNVRLYRHLVL